MTSRPELVTLGGSTRRQTRGDPAHLPAAAREEPAMRLAQIFRYPVKSLQGEAVSPPPRWNAMA
jgi:hypothetical protein